MSENKKPAVRAAGGGSDNGPGDSFSTLQCNTGSEVAQLARAEIRSLLGGDAPDGREPGDFGDYRDVIVGMRVAFEETGADGARKAFTAMVREAPSLGVLIASEPAPRKVRWTAEEILATQFPEPKWAIPGIVPVGLTVLAGRPKVGKSWLALQISGAVATGGRALDQKIERGRVLYLALEDSPRRLQERMVKQQIPAVAGLNFCMEWRSFGEGGLSDLQAEIERGGYQLVVIDTLSRAIGRADQQDAGEMTVITGNLQHLSHLYDLAILLIDHHRKNSGFVSSPIDDILGATAKAAVADAAMGLYKEPGKQGATLKILGRDIEERELALQWDGEYCLWQLLGEAGEVRADTVKGEILMAIEDLVALGEIPSSTNIARHIEKDRAQVSRALADLLNGGDVVKGEKVGRQQPYLLPSRGV